MVAGHAQHPRLGEKQWTHGEVRLLDRQPGDQDVGLPVA